IETAKRGLEVHPTYAIAHNILGRCYLEKKMHALAVEEFQLTIRNDPQNLIGYKMLATTFEKQGMLDQALKHYQMVLDLEPGEIEVAEKIEKIKAEAGAESASQSAPLPQPETKLELAADLAPAPEPSPQPEPSAVAPETPAAPAEVPEAIQLESVTPEAPQALSEEPKQELELVIEKAAEPVVSQKLEQEPAAPEPAVPEPVSGKPAEDIPAPPAEGEATPTLAEIYARQGHFEQAIGIYQKLIADNPGNESYKTKLDELLAKAYPDEMSQVNLEPKESPAPEVESALPAKGEEAPTLAWVEPAEAPVAEAPEKMFSQMFAEMENVVTAKEPNIPEQEEAASEPIQLATEPAKEEVKTEPAQPTPAPEAAAEPAVEEKPAVPETVDFGALFTSEEKSSLGLEPARKPAAEQKPAAGRTEEPKKDEAVSSFQSWLNSLQK
ncbi:MAG: tetratricopeptide repeat protein, partial [Candidatus Edwardsbacteria bacterium]|nr:tetratricopeptide repeat protein [Candidatus Edwardsbacteria bacterium]